MDIKKGYRKNLENGDHIEIIFSVREKGISFYDYKKYDKRLICRVQYFNKLNDNLCQASGNGLTIEDITPLERYSKRKLKDFIDNIYNQMDVVSMLKEKTYTEFSVENLKINTNNL